MKLTVDNVSWRTSPEGKITSVTPRDRLEETRAALNEANERIARLEDMVYVLTGRKTPLPPEPKVGAHNRGCNVNWADELGSGVCTCPERKT